MRTLIISLFILSITACTFKSNDKAAKRKGNEAITLATPKNNAETVVAAYIGLKEAFFQNRITLIDSANAVLNALTNSLKQDTTLKFEKGVVDSVALLTGNIVKETSIENKLKQFKNLMSPLKQIAQKSSYKLYQQNCPMATEFSKDENVYWLSKDKFINNPFYPQNMANCGLVVDSVN